MRTSKDPPHQTSRACAFTLIELLVVVSLIALLIAILLPALGGAREASKQTQCISNMRQFAVAWLAFPMDHKGDLVGSENSKGWTDITGYTQQTAWVLNASGTAETRQNLADGDLWEYMNQAEPVYKCPSDPRSDYIRSYSFSTYLNGVANASWHAPGWQPARQFTDVKRASETLLFLDEPDPRNYNVNSFAFAVRGAPTSYQWVDWPADFHFSGFPHAFADGHAEFYRFQDGRTKNISWFYEVHPGSMDWDYVADIYDPGEPNNP